MRKLIPVIFIAAIIIISKFFIFNKPSNQRNWESGFEKTAEISVNDKDITIKNVRNWRYDKEKPISFDYKDQTVNINDITQAWFLIEPFDRFNGIAHTYFVFDFENQEPLVFSIEARREKDEKYSGFKGLFNQYDLIYVWGTEQDVTGRRVMIEDNKVYMYPLTVSKENTQKLFISVVQGTKELEQDPKFYNTLTTNCTNTLASHANEVKPNTIPIHYAMWLTGYADRLLYERGYIPNHWPFKEIQEQYEISGIVKNIYSQPSDKFSIDLRKDLQKN